MQTQSETHALPHGLTEVANTLRLTGWIGFWLQLGLAIVSGVAVLFSATGRNFTEETSTGIGIALFWAVAGILALGFTIYLFFRYTRIAKRLPNPNPALRPHKADTIKLIRLGLIVSLAGILVNILGAGSITGVMVAKTVSQPPGVAITDPYKIVRALDVFVVVANLNGITAHFLGTISSLWLLQQVQKH